jgi:ATP-dependent exoDNAse (exonuclease V) alpha subunit
LNRVLYTGMSRAKTMLIVVAHDSYKETLKLRTNLYEKLIALQETT